MSMNNYEWAQLMEECGGYEGPEEHLGLSKSDEIALNKGRNQQEKPTLYRDLPLKSGKLYEMAIVCIDSNWDKPAWSVEVGGEKQLIAPPFGQGWEQVEDGDTVLVIYERFKSNEGYKSARFVLVEK